MKYHIERRLKMTEYSSTTDKKTSLFKNHIDFYGKGNNLGEHDYYFLRIMMDSGGEKKKLLDIGGGSGKFASLVKDNIPDMEITIIDPCIELLDMIEDDQIRTIQGSLPNNLCCDKNQYFNYIHTKEVLHHVVGHSIRSSKQKVTSSMLNISNMLENNGCFFIHELYYEGYVIPTLPRTLIFHLCRIQESLNIKIPVSEFLEGLLICFYTREEFKSLIEGCGFEILDYQEIKWKVTYKAKLIGIKNWGRMLFVVKKKNGDIRP